jgi:glutamine synthetase
VASELEFYLFRPGFQPLGDGRPAYSMVHLQDLRGLVESILLSLPVIGLEPEAGLHEYAPGQLEINFGPLAPVEMADRTFLFKNIVKELAAKAGFLATFMAKPIAQHSGSGYHLHASLWKEGKNLFWNGDQPGPSDILRHFVAGNIARARELFPIFAPNINSYRRHVLGEYVPSSASWGGDDRTVALRLPAPTPKAARLEHRISGADANPHLLIAGILAAGLDGVRNKTPLSQHANEHGPVFPRTLGEALDLLDQSTWVREAFGDQAVEIFLTVKRQELQKFHSQITTWELETYGHAL